MDTKTPFFSICIPTYEMNGLGASYLMITFEILSVQTFTNFEVIISDHSKDNSIEDLCTEFKNTFDIKYIRNEAKRGSSSANINSAIKNARGEWIKVLFQDDYLLGSNALEIIFDQINNSEGGWLVCACQHTNDGVNLFDSHFPSFHSNIHLGENTIGAPSNIAFKNKGSLFFDRNLIWLMDCELYKRLELKFGPPIILDQICIVNRLGAHQVTNTLIHNDLVRKELRYVKNKYKIFDFLSSINFRNLFLNSSMDIITLYLISVKDKLRNLF
jgi:glycosyltransferase involved in cell wall biosynthesis